MRDRVEPLIAADIATAADLADRYGGVQARDLVHVAVMQRLGTRRIVTADAIFDRFTEVDRLSQADVGTWGGPLLAET
jgi:predicted nucleic acid-binding protein